MVGATRAYPLLSAPENLSTTTDVVMCPVTFAAVRSMSGMRSMPNNIPTPANGTPATSSAGARVTKLALGTPATVSDTRNVARMTGPMTAIGIGTL